MILLQTTGKLKGKMRRNFSDEEFQQIKELTPWISNETRKTIRERVFCILNTVTQYPLCPVCGKYNKFLKSGKYSVACSQSCGISHEEVQKKIKSTKLERYGSETFVNPEKAARTTSDKYGVTHTSKLTENRNKAKRTSELKYGDENYNNNIQIKLTNNEKYGVYNPSKSKIIKDKISKSIAKNYALRRQNDIVSGYVYIIHFKNLSLIKIGSTGNFERRTAQLKKDFGEFDVLAVHSVKNCYSLESDIHSHVNQYRICLDEGCGRTEFFKDECLDDVIRYVSCILNGSLL